MKRLAAVLLLASIAQAHAQAPQILGFSNAGSIIWTNAETNVYGSLYFTWDPGDQWFPVWVNRLVTNPIESGPTHLNMIGGDDTNVFAAMTAGQFDTTRAFYKIVSSASPLLPSPLVTNEIVFVNSSTSEVTDIQIEICWGNVLVSDVAPGATSQLQSVSATFPWAWDYRYQSNLVFDDDACLFFQGTYFQQGIRKDLYFPFQFFSIPGYSLVITMYNVSYTVESRELQPFP